MYRKAYPHFGFHFLKSCERIIFPCNTDRYPLVTSFIGALKILALQSEAKIKKLFFDIKTTINIKLGSILEKHTQRNNRREQTDLDECDNKTCTSIQLLQIQKKQLTDLQEHLERYCNILPLFSCNSAKYDLKLMKYNLLPILVNERNIKLNVIKKVDQFISFKLGDIQLLDIMNFVWGATSLDSFWKAYQTSETKDSSSTNELVTPTQCRIDNFPRLMLSTVNFAAATLSKPNTQTMLIYWKVDWQHNKLLSNWNLLELRFIITCNRYGSKNKWAHSGNFCGGITTKMLCQLWWQCKKWLLFTTTKISIYWSLVVHYQTWLTFAYTNPPMQNFIPSQREIETYWKKNEKTLLGAHLSFLHAKQLLMKLSSESLQSYANLLLQLMPANYTPIRCANPCPPVSIRVGISIQKPVDSHLDKIRPLAAKIWSCFLFNVQYLIVKLRASTLQADRKKLIASVLMGFVLIAILCLKQWVAFTTFVHVKCCAHLSRKKISNVVVGEENSMN